MSKNESVAFRREIFWLLNQAMKSKPESLTENAALLIMYAGLMDFTLSRINK